MRDFLRDLAPALTIATAVEVAAMLGFLAGMGLICGLLTGAV